MTFNESETTACRQLVKLALEEDLGQAGDLTSQAVIPTDLKGQGTFVARGRGVIAGLPAVALVLSEVDPNLKFWPIIEDGSPIQSPIADVEGSTRSILAAERTALNFLQHLSGIATLTRKYVDAIEGLPCKILDTRKTTPGWRLLEKYAVRCGGGHNHRMGLYDGILIKDNHLMTLKQATFQKPGDLKLTIAEAVHRVRQQSPSLQIEMEIDILELLDAVLDAGPDIVLLDNMPLEHMREAVRRRNQKAPPILLEASGGITLANVRAVAETGVDRISIGALTHSAPALDIALDYA